MTVSARSGRSRTCCSNDGISSPWTILIVMLLSFIIMGTFLDDTAMLVIVAPLYIPLVGSLGFDLIWFGILYTITCQIAYITPPFGYNLFLMRAMAPPEITLIDIYRSIIPFFFMMVLTIIAAHDLSADRALAARPLFGHGLRLMRMPLDASTQEGRLEMSRRPRRSTNATS